MTLEMYDEQKDALPLRSIENVIAVAAGKGGVGKSSVAVNLARALQSLGRKVGILDADVYGPSVRRLLPEDRLPKPLEGGFLQTASAEGIQVMSMAYFRKEEESAAVRAPIVNSLINQFINHTQWGELDDLIIDFPPGTGDIQLTLCQQANVTGALMCTTPSKLSSDDVLKAMNLFEKVHIPLIGILENMSYYLNDKTGEKISLFGSGSGKELALQSGLPLLEQLPIDPDFASLSDQGLSIFEKKPKAPLAVAFRSLAKKVLSHLEDLKRKDSKALEGFEVTFR